MNVVTDFRNLTLTRFLEEIDYNDFLWIVKRLSGNDTGLTGGHQAGLYLPRIFFETAIPEICTTEKYNPDFFIDECYFPWNDYATGKLRAIYYNSKYFPEKGLKKKYNEFRLTQWGGSASPVQDVENTGSICILAFHRDHSRMHAVAWVSSSLEEEHDIENWLGEEVEPGRFYMKQDSESDVFDHRLPASWFERFPSGKDIFNYVAAEIPNKRDISVDTLLLRRRDFEFRIFKHLEKKEVMPKIRDGFRSIDDFMKIAHSVSNRRKSRTGGSLELNLDLIFRDEKLQFEREVVTENKKKPDFIFPSAKAYHSKEYLDDNLQMLASKTCCKDRWRQIMSEADRIKQKHLFTLQEGISSNQLTEMTDSSVLLVVPGKNIHSFPKEWRSSIKTLGQFVGFIRDQQSNIQDLHQWTT